MLPINDWSGELDEPDFLARLYPLGKMPSKDYRYTNAYDDVRQHRVNNDDWSNDYVFVDDRFNLLWGTDENLLKFLEMTLHPLVRPTDSDDTDRLVKAYNHLLIADGYAFALQTVGEQSLYRVGKATGSVPLDMKHNTSSAVEMLDSHALDPQPERHRPDAISPAVSVPLTKIESAPASQTASDASIFIVHGHDDATKHEVALFLNRLTSIDPVILHEQPNDGLTIIAKLERAATTANYAVVLLTADDLGQAKGDSGLVSRARQNVVFEMGYFMAKLGTERVAVLHENGVEAPGDMNGMVYIPYGSFDNWKNKLAGELKSRGIRIFPDALLR